MVLATAWAWGAFPTAALIRDEEWAAVAVPLLALVVPVVLGRWRHRNKPTLISGIVLVVYSIVFAWAGLYWFLPSGVLLIVGASPKVAGSG